jgi:hypothetical protein
MDDSVKNLTELFTSLADLLPGFILLYIRSRLTNGKLPSATENIALYTVLSAIYYIMIGPILHFETSISSLWGSYLIRIFVFLVLPALLGVGIGVMDQRKTVQRAFAKVASLGGLSVNIVDPISSAWDWKFARAEPSFVIVKLKNGTCVYGFAGGGSFMSSDPNERDIYIEQVYILGPKGDLEQTASQGIWIGAGEISTIEFIPEVT